MTTCTSIIKINIAYRPALSGCHNNEYFPMYHQGTIYLSKKQPSTSQQDGLHLIY